jgi:hypothetical protein
MANEPESLTTTQMFKKRYVDGLKNPIPTSAKVQRLLDFKSAEKLGDEYQWGVSLALPHGHTWNGGANYGTLIDLNDARSGVIRTAKAKGCEYLNRTQVPYGVLTKGQTSKQAFKPVMDTYMSRLIEATAHGIEMMTLWGGMSLGKIGVKGANAGAVWTATITEASWASGLWKASQGMPIDIFEPDATYPDKPGAAKRTNAGAAIVTVVSGATRQVTITLANVSDYAGITVNDVIVPFNAKNNWTSGMDDILTLSAAGANLDVLGINPSQFGLWRANSFSAGSAPMTMTKFIQACAELSVNAGDPSPFGGDGDVGDDKQSDEPYVFLCSPYTQIDMITDQAALRRFVTPAEAGKLRNGGSALIFDTPVGPVRIVPTSYMKAGKAMFIRPSEWHFIGSSLPTFGIPGKPGDEGLVVDIPGKNGFEVQRYADLGVVADVLSTSLIVTGIDNASLS